MESCHALAPPETWKDVDNAIVVVLKQVCKCYGAPEFLDLCASHRLVQLVEIH